MHEAQSEVILYEVLEEHVALITLNRPDKRNAVNGAMAQALDAAVKCSEADPNIRVVILTSSNTKVFCAGADLAEVAAGHGVSLSTADGGFGGFVYHPRTKPWIAAARGNVLGGGMEFCLACDLIVAGEDCMFGLPEVKRGFIAAAGGNARLPRRIPSAIANEMLITGEPIDAARAYALGLVNRVVPAAEVLETACRFAMTIAANAPLAVGEALRLAHETDYLADEDARQHADATIGRLRRSEDFREGPRAFLEKRAPVWLGR
jgi:enoyl-CoA hydratase/carnithine racemase